MKICYLFREKERNAHSIEILFNTIADEVQKNGFEVERWYKPLSNFKAVFQARKLRADIYHITGDCYFLSLFLPWNKTIMTVHDIGMYKNHKKSLKKKVFVFMSFMLPIKLLKVSTAISHLTKNDLVQILNVNSDKIKVINNPLVLPLTFYNKTFNIQKPVILQIGTGDHKNLNGLIEAVREIDCFLEIIGNPDKVLIQKMDNYKIEYSISRNISNEEVIAKYQDCDILFFASFSEGFGLPILEAQAVGRPVITSNTEPTRTVCGEGGILVDPKSSNEIREAIVLLISDESAREACITNGLSNINKYKKEIIAKEYIGVYNSFFRPT